MDEVKRTIASIKAGRAVLNWSQKDLSERSSVAMVTIARMEAEIATPNAKTVSKLKKAIEEAGVYFADNSPQGGFSMIVTKDSLK